MILWAIFAVMTAFALTAILYPLSRREVRADAREDFDASVYKDQLEEVEADVARGLMSEDDAQAARIEISRRLIANADKGASGSEGAEGSQISHGNLIAVVVIAAVCVPFLSLGLYLGYGSPGIPDQPRAARMKAPADQQRIDELVARVEAKLRENPEDGTGWDVIAPVYLKYGRFNDAADAFSKAIRLKGENKQRLFGLGEAIRLTNNGVVTEEAKEAFEKSVKLDENYVPALYRLAVALEQDGRYGDAVKAWKDIVERSPNGLAWRQEAQKRLAMAEARASGKPLPPPSDASAGPGPTKEQIEAVQQMSPSDRQAMINSMVSRLAERLKEDSGDLQGWLRLVRAYTVLGRRDDAEKALSDARKSFTGNGEALGALDDLAKQLGLGA